MADFLKALEEVKPAFGAVIEGLESYRLHGMIDYGPRYHHLLSSCRTLVHQVRAGGGRAGAAVCAAGLDRGCLAGFLPCLAAACPGCAAVRQHMCARLALQLPPCLPGYPCPPEQARSSANTPLVTCLLEGPAGTGKTALAATLAIESGFPFVKVLSAEGMVGYSEQAKCSQIAKVFDDAYKVGCLLSQEAGKECCS